MLSHRKMETQEDEETDLCFCNETGFALASEFRANYCLALKSQELAWASWAGPTSCCKIESLGGSSYPFTIRALLSPPDSHIDVNKSWLAHPASLSTPSRNNATLKGHRCPSMGQHHSNHPIEEVREEGKSYLMSSSKVSNTTPGAIQSLTHLFLLAAPCGWYNCTHFKVKKIKELRGEGTCQGYTVVSGRAGVTVQVKLYPKTRTLTSVTNKVLLCSQKLMSLWSWKSPKNPLSSGLQSEILYIFLQVEQASIFSSKIRT